MKQGELNQKLQRELILKMPKCVYCDKDYEFPKGLSLVTNKGTVNYLCSSKCRKNMKMGRRKIRWVSKRKKTSEKSA